MGIKNSHSQDKTN